MDKNEILQKANKILLEERKNQEHINICVLAKICPECGEPLITKEDKNFNDVTKCSVDKKHYKKVIGYYDDEEA